MDTKQKAEILIQFTQDYFDDERFDDFFNYNDLGIPLAVAVYKDLINFTQEGLELFNETWNNLCELFNADPNEEYEDIEDLIGE